VACYIINSDEYESLMSWGLVLDINEIEDLFVLDNAGYARWWPSKRWRVIREEDNSNNLKKN